ncbi:protein MODIFYING WALL LIGNIN-1 isoform X2 [Cucumis sativus]|uniref:Uncharacterized protein n=1 Tax=Cucumis sativus TaxID=3659 RepID=A0A0A0L099_CUCSA|nr:protein MODIFYING WALL LIGNIN-1 isoform X2 [Cucumis sativus]
MKMKSKISQVKRENHEFSTTNLQHSFLYFQNHDLNTSSSSSSSSSSFRLLLLQPAMESPSSSSFVISFSVVAILTLASFASCMAAEFNRTKKEDLKLNAKLCFLPESEAFKLGIGGLLCLIMAQIIGTTLICHSYWPKEHRKSCSVKKPLLSIALLISWVSFVIAVIMVSGATSMSRRQEYAKGWVEGECYLVKDGIFVSAAVLVLINGGSTIASAAIGMRRWRTNHVIKPPNQIHAQIG